jgi:hypothetical protein
MTFTHFFADTSKAVPPLQAVHDLSEPESVTSDLHETHFAAAASQAMAALQAVAEVKLWALAVLTPMPTEAASIKAARRNFRMRGSPLVNFVRAFRWSLWLNATYSHTRYCYRGDCEWRVNVCWHSAASADFCLRYAGTLAKSEWSRRALRFVFNSYSLL